MAVVKTVIADLPDRIVWREVDEAAGYVGEGVDWKPGSFQGNSEALLAKARTALNANEAFLARPSPTNAQNAAQIQALTRQVDALIRLVTDELADVSGT